MTPFRSGITFALIIVLYTGASLLMSFIAWRGGSLTLTILQNILISESIILIPGLSVAAASGTEVGEIFRFKKIRLKTGFLVVLFMFCIEPLTSLVNGISMMFSDNMAMDMAEQYLKDDNVFITVALVISVIGPFIEELVFRGIIYAGLRKSGRFLAAILIQAFLFGLMHLNLNQMSYGILLGIAFGILDEVTGSLWPGLIGHFMINFGTVVNTYAIMKYMPEAFSQDFSKADMIYTLAFFAFLSLIFTGVAVLILLAIAKSEPGGRFRLHRIFHSTELKAVNSAGETVTVKRPGVITIPLVIGVVIAIVEIIATMIIGIK